MNINEAIENFSGRIADWTSNNMPKEFYVQALREAGILDPHELEALEESANGLYEDPKYSLYWATLGQLLTKSLIKAADLQRHFFDGPTENN